MAANWHSSALIRSTSIRGNAGDLSIGAGKYNYEYTVQRTISGSSVGSGEDMISNIYFLQYAWKNWFVRYTRMDADDSAPPVAGLGSVAGSTSGIPEPLSIENDWLWLGYRFSY